MQVIQTMKTLRAASAVLGVLLLSACGGGGGGPSAQASADPTVQVAPSASTNAAVATSYTNSLASTPPATTDTLEPLPVPAALATDDTAEPV